MYLLAALDLVIQNKTGLDAIKVALKDAAQATKHTDHFMKAKCIIYHGLVFDASCSCEPRHKEYAPAYT